MKEFWVGGTTIVSKAGSVFFIVSSWRDKKYEMVSYIITHPDGFMKLHTVIKSRKETLLSIIGAHYVIYVDGEIEKYDEARLLR